jgi:hypothetical protein
MLLTEKAGRPGEAGVGCRADYNLEIAESILKLLDDGHSCVDLAYAYRVADPSRSCSVCA